MEGKEGWKKRLPSLPSLSSILPFFPPIASIQKTNVNIERELYSVRLALEAVSQNLVPVFDRLKLVRLTNLFSQFLNFRVLKFDNFAAPKADEVGMLLEGMDVFIMRMVLRINDFRQKAAFDEQG
jgi:hypothetical protein